MPSNLGTEVIEQLLVRLLGDDKAYQIMLDNAVKETIAFSNQVTAKIEAVGESFKSLGKNLSLFVTTPLIGLGIATIKTAADAEESQGKFETVFSKIGGAARLAADELDRSFGMSGVAARKALANSGDLLTGFGFTQKAALDLSTRIQKLSADLTSYNNLEEGAAIASDALTRGILGQTRALASLGILISDEEVKGQVALNRIKGMTFETEKHAEAMAILELVYKRSSNAIGDFAKNSNSLSNITKEVRGDMEDLSDELGKVQLPFVKSVANALKEMVSWLKQVSPETLKWAVAIGAAAAVLGPLFLVVGQVAAALRHIHAVYTGVTLAMGASPIVIAAVTRAVKILKGAILGLGQALVLFGVSLAALKIGERLGEMFADVKKARRLQAEAEAESARLDKLIAERQARAATTSGPTKRGQTDDQINAVKALKSQIDALNFSLQVEAGTLGKTAAQARIYALEMQGASKHALRDLILTQEFIDRKEKEAKVHQEAADAQREAAELAQRNVDALVAQGTAVTEQFMTPVEAFNKRMEELSRLQRVGAITNETFNRAIKATGKSLQEALLEEEKGRNRSARLGAGDFLNAGSLEAKIRAEEQKELLSGGKKDDKVFRIQEKIEEHLRIIRDAALRGQATPVVLEPANFN